jgi:hypothetical protein
MVDGWTQGCAQDCSTRRSEAAVRLDNLVPRRDTGRYDAGSRRCGYLPEWDLDLLSRVPRGLSGALWRKLTHRHGGGEAEQEERSGKFPFRDEE